MQQQDLYRALVLKCDSGLIGSESEEPSARTIVKKQSERTKTLEEHCWKFEQDYYTARSELDSVMREKEAVSEQRAQYKTHNADLTSLIDRLQLQVSSLKANAAHLLLQERSVW